jgi:hypothetical protein
MRLPSLKILRLLPLVALVGVDGFVLFAPYLILMLSVAYVVKQLKSAVPQPAADGPSPAAGLAEPAVA